MVSMFKLFKKKKKDSNKDLPPPLPPEIKRNSIPKGDLPTIFPDKEFPKLPKKRDFPELNFPKMPKMPPEHKPVFSPPSLPKKSFPRFKQIPKVFDKTIEEKMPSKKIVKPRLKPIFVDVDDYKSIINNTNVIRSKLLEAEDFAKKLNHLQDKEEKILDKWSSRLEELDKKLTYVDKVISKAQG